MSDMSKKEASEWLIAIKRDYIYGGDEDYDKRRKLALDMGAEALENQKTGHWISDTVDGWFKCSECEHLELGKTIYCSSCGAKMEGE